MLVRTINGAWELQKEFEKMGRGKSFTRYDLMAQYYEDIDESVELDVIALCGEWNEFETIEDYNNDYGTDYETIEDLANDETVLHDDENAPFLVIAH